MPLQHEPVNSIPYKTVCAPSEDSDQSDQSSHGTLIVTKDSMRLHVDREDTGHHARMRRLISVFAGRKCNLVGDAVTRRNRLKPHAKLQHQSLEKMILYTASVLT